MTPPRAAAALLLLALAACHRAQDAADIRPAGEPASPPPTPFEQRLLAQLPPAYAKADLENGALHFNLCKPCHSIAAGGPNMTGPNLHGLFGREVASEPGFSYSSALSARSWRWDAAHLDGWLKSPRAYAPGTKMSFYGIPDDEDRRDLIAYLKIASSSPAAPP